MSNITTGQAADGHRVWQYIYEATGGESMRSFGKRSHIDPSLISRWKAGDVRPSTDLLQRVADTLGVSHSTMLKLGGYTSEGEDVTPADQVRRTGDVLDISDLPDEDKSFIRHSVELARLRPGK